MAGKLVEGTLREGELPARPSTISHSPTIRYPEGPIAESAPIPIDPRLVDEGEIARGGMGAIHLVFDRHIRRRAAMKLLDGAIARDEEAVRRFLDEAQITGQLDHPNVVPVYDLDLDDARRAPRAFTMKLVEGHTLAEAITPSKIAVRTDGELLELLHVFLKVCDAVAFAHSRGVVHRDLKPQNVMIGAYGQVYVMDWGIARVVPGEGHVTIDGDPIEEEGAVIGTPHYMPPEQAWGRVREVDARSDVFALGAMLYQVLVGVPPYQGNDVAEVLGKAREGKVCPPAEAASHRVPPPPALCEIAMRALTARPSDRYPSVEAMRAEIERTVRTGWWFGSKTYAPREVIVAEGDPAFDAYIIERGRCEAFKTIEGERTSLRIMGAGDVFGEAALLADGRRTASVIALDEVVVKVVTRDALDRELRGDSWLGKLVRALAERFRETDELVTRSSFGRIPITPKGDR